MKKLFILTCLSFVAVIIAIKATQQPAYLYNAYDPGTDEFFILKSYSQLDNKSTVWYNDSAVVVGYPTQFVAQIQSVYHP